MSVSKPETEPVTLARAPWALQDPLLTDYYDTEWGMPVVDEDGVFERLTLEAFQSGLSWLTILRKRDNFRRAFDGFLVERVAAYTDDDTARLLADSGIIRNRLKIAAAISNARAVLAAHERGETLAEIVWSHMPEVSPTPRNEDEVPASSPESAALASALKRRGFSFVGPTTAYALMTAIGIVDGHVMSSHRRGCSGLWNADGTLAAGVVRGAVPSL